MSGGGFDPQRTADSTVQTVRWAWRVPPGCTAGPVADLEVPAGEQSAGVAFPSRGGVMRPDEVTVTVTTDRVDGARVVASVGVSGPQVRADGSAGVLRRGYGWSCDGRVAAVEGLLAGLPGWLRELVSADLLAAVDVRDGEEAGR